MSGGQYAPAASRLKETGVLIDMGQRARRAARQLARAGAEQKNRALAALAEGLAVNAPAILDANRRDVADA